MTDTRLLRIGLNDQAVEAAARVIAYEFGYTLTKDSEDGYYDTDIFTRDFWVRVAYEALEAASKSGEDATT